MKVLNGLVTTYILILFSLPMMANLTIKTEKEFIRYDMESDLVKVYPNPFVSTLHLELNWISEDFTTVKIYNIIGKQIYLQSFEPGAQIITIDSNTFEKGIYFVEIKSGNKKNTQRIIKK